jgi:hypothetical protein
MPDLRQDLADYLVGLVNDKPSFTKVRYSKSYVDFMVRDWQEIPEFNVGTGWAGSSATVAIEFSNSQNQLNLFLLIGPVEQENRYIREAIFAHAAANRDVFKGCRPALTKKWTMLYKMPFLQSHHYEDASLEDLVQIIEPKWDRFVQDVLPQLHAHLMQIRFD